MNPDVSTMPLTGLLRLYGDLLRELVRRGVCRSKNNPVADIAETLVSRALHLRLMEKSTKGYDAVDELGKRYEIKARRLTPDNPSRMLSVLRDCEGKHFEYLAGILFRQDFSVQRACLIPLDVVLAKAPFRKHVNGRILELKNELWDESGVIDITTQVASALAALDSAAATATA